MGLKCRRVTLFNRGGKACGLHHIDPGRAAATIGVFDHIKRGVPGQSAARQQGGGKGRGQRDQGGAAGQKGVHMGLSFGFGLSVGGMSVLGKVDQGRTQAR